MCLGPHTHIFGAHTFTRQKILACGPVHAKNGVPSVISWHQDSRTLSNWPLVGSECHFNLPLFLPGTPSFLRNEDTCERTLACQKWLKIQYLSQNITRNQQRYSSASHGSNRRTKPSSFYPPTLGQTWRRMYEQNLWRIEDLGDHWDQDENLVNVWVACK